MKHNNSNCARRCYWLLGNSIDGVCCHPRRQRMTEQELIAYLETNFLIDFNASRGEFDFTIYLDQPTFRMRLLYGYYLKGPRSSVVACADYMTADSIGRVVRRGGTFLYYGRPGFRHNRPVLRIKLPCGAAQSAGDLPNHRTNNERKICQGRTRQEFATIAHLLARL